MAPSSPPEAWPRDHYASRQLSRPAPRPFPSHAPSAAGRHARPRSTRRGGGVEGNSRLTSGLALAIFVLLFLEGVTILSVQRLLTAHVVIGAILIPPVAAKIGSTTWRMVRYYTGSREYRRKGPPRPLLRLLGPVLVILTVVLLASGVGLVVGAPVSWRPSLFALHRAVFVAWFGVMVLHVLGHLLETARVAPRDWFPYTRRQVRGASTRQWFVGATLVAGLVVGAALAPFAAGWRLV